ncbi:polyribonucleotide nucleotidyltransferase [Gemmata sp. G18]|uniref:Polyribonucleotide nucleotidyltransferase n=1 Tax=Gemmata palustris TaxID=2822762 RepID=A0ABS5BV73_9BACT|nr:polyribonucleotide nucleotidyltransferase [Gemmata palustris]MBP3957625.1 polyribonucleotide nucleotidyltransferase [Gemmata palustris]
MPVNPARVECQFGGRTLTLETGKLAKQAHGAVLVTYGETSVLVAAVEGSPIPGRDFFPLQVEYRERTYAAGKFPGGFIKRETRPSTKETLTSRLIDRPSRPLFPTNYFNEVQIHCTVISSDRENDADMLALIGTSAALHVSHIPFLKPYGGLRLGRVNGELIVLPTATQMEESDLDLIVAATRDAVCMIEGFAREMPEQEMGDAIMEAHKQCAVLIDAIEQLRTEAGQGPKVLPPATPDNPLAEELYAKYGTTYREKYLTKGKKERNAALDELKDEVKKVYVPEGETNPKWTAAQVSSAMSVLRERVFREITLGGTRIDGRAPKDLRNLSGEVAVLPRTHGTAVFQRGETQALVVVTLGTVADEQKVDGLQDEYSKKFYLDYNFPPYSVGECKPIRGPGRREIGHGMLAERSLKAVIPPPTRFPYTIRLVSEILESNGSSSMASVCGGTLALMDAGVPIKRPVAGISVGLVMEKDNFTLLTDIQGDEDHYGDMDFKVAGTQKGVTGIQLDIKVDGVNEAIVRGALEQAKEGRLQILKVMLATLSAPRKDISRWAPRLIQLKINPEMIGKLIGPGGKMIRAIQEETGAKIDIEDDGTVSIASADAESVEAARRMVEGLTAEVKVGAVYDGKVISIKEFGAFIEIAPGRDGLCHVSELDSGFVQRPEDVVQIGDKVQVKVIAIDDQGRVKLSRKALLAPREDDGSGGGGGGGGYGDRGGGGGDRGDRGGDRGDRGGRGGDRGGPRGGGPRGGGRRD